MEFNCRKDIENIPTQTPVLVLLKCKNWNYKFYTVITRVGYHEVNTEDMFWGDYDGPCEYDEEKDCFWVSPCYYETNYIDDNPNWIIDEEDYEIIEWAELPEVNNENCRY